MAMIKIENLSNPKIDRARAGIAKTEERIKELRDKLRDQRQELTQLENEEIVALYRKERYNEDEYAALLQAQHNPDDTEEQPVAGQYAEGGQGHEEIHED